MRYVDAYGVEREVLHSEDWRDTYHVPVDRLQPHHFITVTESSWHMTHPITCHLAACEFDKGADELTERLDVGRYRWRHAGQMPTIVQWGEV